MKDTLKPGTHIERKITVDKDRTISFMGEDLRVYATPWMVLDIEQTCRDLLLDHHDEGEDSVGAHIAVDHMGATLLGDWVEVRAKVTEVEGPRVTFEVEVHDAVEQVGRGRHVRFAIDTAKQAKRLQAKAAKVKEAG